MFARLEGEAKPIIDRLFALPAGMRWLDPHDRTCLSIYIALQHARAPATRAHSDAVAELGGAVQLDMRLSEVERRERELATIDDGLEVSGPRPRRVSAV